MNLSFWDYGIVALFAIVVFGSVFYARTYVRSVSDFLATNRSTGRYLLTISQGLCGVGAISILAFWQQNFTSGFSMSFWGFAMNIVVLVVAISGWISYRYRQTRCLTLAQFFEERYSRKFRVFAGGLAFISGIINYGIFPAIEAHFFIYFTGIPEISFYGFPVTFAATMMGILGLSILFVWLGGQVAVVITDFFQGLFVSLAMVFLVGTVLLQVGWEPIIALLENTPAQQSLVNPFETGEVEVFNFWFFAISVLIVIYNKMSWQGTQGFNASAKNAHEAKMGEVLSSWRGFPYGMMYLVIPIACCAVISAINSDAVLSSGIGFNEVATGVEHSLANISKAHGAQVADQLKTPLILIHILPTGIKGLLIAIMLAAAISTHASYLHSWGTIFIQDIVMPIRQRPFEPKTHLLILRLAILGVSIFAFIFSMLYTPTDAILPFMMITAAIFVGGSGAVLIGGLYWKRGSTLGAWMALITGGLTATAAILIPLIWRTYTLFIWRIDCAEWIVNSEIIPFSNAISTFLSHDKFPIDGAWMTLFTMAIASSAYVVGSMVSRTSFNLDKLLHRGAFAIQDDQVQIDEPPSVHARLWKLFGMGKEFTMKDKILVVITYAWTFSWTAFFIVITLLHFIFMTFGIPSFADSWWIEFWEIYIWLNLGIGLVVTIWFSIGGTRDLLYMFKKLSSTERDDSDNGFVQK